MRLEASSFNDVWVKHLEGDRSSRTAAEQIAFVFLADGESEQERMTFAELHARVAAAAEVVSERAARGERAILMYPQGLDFIVAFLGCLAAGVIPVPVNTPQPRASLSTLSAIARDSGARLLLSSGNTLGKLEAKLAVDEVLGGVVKIDTARWPRTPAGTGLLRRGSGNDLALIQYTSGSTGAPRGVAVTHANLIENHRQAVPGFGSSAESVVASWLPMFHDMGLGQVLHCLWLGVPCILMPPAAFLQKPARWLQAISRYRVTLTGAPDFAYDLCTRRVAPEEKRELDLSSWRTAYDGSEPIRAAVVEAFIREFACCKFRAEAFHPVYGLAEATLLVTAKPPLQANRIVRFSRNGLARGEGIADDSADGTPLVGCGTTWLGAGVRIVDPNTSEALPDGRIGEVWVSGPCVAAGYWGKEEETIATFRAHTRTGEGPFLRTGDLGVMHAGQLFITGRYKDLIIIRGKNHYPQDIEACVSTSHSALEPLRCAAVALPHDGAERLLIVQEVRRTALGRFDTAEVFEAMRGAIAREHGVAVDVLVLIHPATLLRTSSGKVRRKASLAAYLDGSLVVLASSVLTPRAAEPASADQLASEAWVRGTAAPGLAAQAPLAPQVNKDVNKDADKGVEKEAVLRRRVEGHILSWIARHRNVAVTEVDPRSPIANFGVDSVARVELVLSLEKLLGVVVSVSELHDIDCIDDLTRLMLRLCQDEPRSVAASPRQEVAGAEPRPRVPPAQAVEQARTHADVALPQFSPINWN